MGDQADAGILYGPRGMLARDFPPCRGVSCAAPADGVPRRARLQKTACPRCRKISQGKGPGSRRRGLPDMVESVQRSGAEPADRDRLRPEPDPAERRDTGDRGARRARRRDRRVLSAVAAGDGAPNLYRGKPLPTRFRPSSASAISGATRSALAVLWELDFWGKFRARRRIGRRRLSRLDRDL